MWTRPIRSVVAALALAAGTIIGLSADQPRATLAVTMTNDAAANQLKVYDATSGALLQVLGTNGRGGVGGNALGVRQLENDLVAAVNYGSSSVAIFRRDGNGLKLEQTLQTSSAPVSVDFGNDHLYIAGVTTVDSFVLHNRRIGWRDGTAPLQLFGSGVPSEGTTAQVGVLDSRHVLVTLKTDPTPGTVDVVALDENGSVTGAVEAVSAPAGTLTPFGFATVGDGTAVITLAHSAQDGLFRNGAFVDVIAAGQAAPCWMTRAGKYLFTANTGSRTISRLVSTGGHVFVDAAVAASVPTGGPSDIDANGGVLGVIDRASGQSHLTLFTYNPVGELTPLGGVINVGAANANGVAIVRPDR